MIHIKAEHDITIEGLSKELAAELVELLQPALAVELQTIAAEFVKANADRIRAAQQDDDYDAAAHIPADVFARAFGVPEDVAAKIREFGREVRDVLQGSKPATGMLEKGEHIHREIEKIHDRLQGAHPLELLWAQNNAFSADRAARQRAHDLLDKLQQRGMVVPFGQRRIQTLLDGSRQLQAAIERDAGLPRRLHSAVPGKTVTMDNGVKALVVDANTFLETLGPSVVRSVAGYVPVLVGCELRWYSGNRTVEIHPESE